MNWKKIPESQGFIQSLGEWTIRQHTFMPRMIDLEISRECNLKCPACMRRADTSLSHRTEKFCSLSQFKAIHKEIPTLGTLNFMGDGEPLMNPEINNIIEYAASKNIYTVFTTNGTLITEADIKHWKRNKVYRIHVSIDAPDEEMYESIRIGANYFNTLRNIEALVRNEIPVCMNMVLTQKNIRFMPEYITLAKNLNVREVSFLMPISAYGPDNKLRPEDDLSNQILFGRAKTLCKSYGIIWRFPLTLCPTFRRLNFPFIRPEITPEGEVWACCYSLGRGKTWMMGEEIDIPEGTYTMGNMFDKGFKDVWYNDAYRELRQVYKNTEVPKGTIISRKEYVKHIQEVQSRTNKKRFNHCEICPARWGTACS